MRIAGVQPSFAASATIDQRSYGDDNQCEYGGGAREGDHDVPMNGVAYCHHQTEQAGAFQVDSPTPSHRPNPPRSSAMGDLAQRWVNRTLKEATVRRYYYDSRLP